MALWPSMIWPAASVASGRWPGAMILTFHGGSSRSGMRRRDPTRLIPGSGRCRNPPAQSGSDRGALRVDAPRRVGRRACGRPSRASAAARSSSPARTRSRWPAATRSCSRVSTPSATTSSPSARASCRGRDDDRRVGLVRARCRPRTSGRASGRRAGTGAGARATSSRCRSRRAAAVTPSRLISQQPRDVLGVVVEHHRLGDLEAELARRDAGRGEAGRDEVGQAGVAELQRPTG